jgi:hypothetical protein
MSKRSPKIIGVASAISFILLGGSGNVWATWEDDVNDMTFEEIGGLHHKHYKHPKLSNQAALYEEMCKTNSREEWIAVNRKITTACKSCELEYSSSIPKVNEVK